MADIELVIKIPEEVYEKALAIKGTDEELCFEDRLQLEIGLENGTPLPKGHGRLIDADVLDRDLENAQVNLEDALSEAFDDGLTWASEVVSKSPPIIKADREN